MSWTKAVASQRVHKYTFPSISLDVVLSTQVPTPLGKEGSFVRVNEMAGTISGYFNMGMVLWDTSFVLGEFLSRQGDLAQVEEFRKLMGEMGML